MILTGGSEKGFFISSTDVTIDAKDKAENKDESVNPRNVLKLLDRKAKAKSGARKFTIEDLELNVRNG